jgi:hypothetical protein
LSSICPQFVFKIIWKLLFLFCSFAKVFFIEQIKIRKMKRMNLKTVILLMGIIGGLSLFSGKEKKEMTELAIHNVEALAGGEGGSPAYCYGTGSIDCYSFKVAIRVDL